MCLASIHAPVAMDYVTKLGVVGKRLNPPTGPRIRKGDEKPRPPSYCDLAHPDPEIKGPGFPPLKRGLDG